MVSPSLLGFLSPGNGGSEGGIKTIESGEALAFFLYATIAVWEKVMFRRKQRKIHPHFSSKEKSEYKKVINLLVIKLLVIKLLVIKLLVIKLLLIKLLLIKLLLIN